MKKILAVFIALSSCLVALGQTAIPKSTWRAALQRGSYDLPFGLEINPKANGKYEAFALNGAERLALDEAYFEGDSLHIPMLIFDSDLVVKVTENEMKGFWKKNRQTRPSEWPRCAHTPAWPPLPQYAWAYKLRLDHPS